MQHQKMAFLGGMVNSIVHDFKSPFQMINLGAEMIDSISQDKQVHRLCMSITDQVGRMLEMSNELGEYSRGQSSFNFQRVNLRELVDQFIENQIILLSKEGFVLEHDIADVNMDADPQKIMRVLQNLVSNAAEAMSGGRGKVIIKAELADGDFLHISVSDDGPGIPESIRDSIWNPFVTAGKPHGIGLGTSIVKSIVEGHGGTIDYTTETGKGTTFTITLPLFQTAVS
jgi:signal transduction histidine kinase